MQSRLDFRPERRNALRHLRRILQDVPPRRPVLPDYDFDRPTNEAHRVQGKEVFGRFADIRSKLDFDYHGSYDEQRQLLQDEIILDTVGKGTRHLRPWVIFTAGAMGAGKGRTIEWLSNEGYFPIPDIVHVDPDVFRTELPEWAGYLAHNKAQAGRMTHRESGYSVEIATEAALRQMKHVWVDGSLRDADWYSEVFATLRVRHPQYRIAIIHVSASWEKVLARATSRAEATGRVVPEDDLRNSFDAVPTAVRRLSPVADFTVHILNEDSVPELQEINVGEACASRLDWDELRLRFADMDELSGKCQPMAEKHLQKLLKEHTFLLFGASYCSYSRKVLTLLQDVPEAKNPHVVDLDLLTAKGGVDGGAGVALRLELERLVGKSTVPQVFFGGEHLGGYDDVHRLWASGELAKRASRLKPATPPESTATA